MANFNKVLLMGNLTRDPELRYAGGGTGGTAICKFGLAVNRQWRNQQSGEQQEETCFVDIVVFARQAETCNEYLQKGRPVFVEGRLSFSQWEDRETGAKRSKLEVVGERVQFLGGRDSGGQRQGGDSWGRDSAPRQQRAPAPTRAPAAQPAPAPAANAGGGGGGGGGGGADFDFDDIPF